MSPSCDRLSPDPRVSRESRSWDRRQFTPQLSSESDGDPILGPASGGNHGPENEILSRYLESLGTGGTSGPTPRSRDDSLNSSDSEYAGASDGEERRRSRTKVNLRHLEERLNMIQEECNRLSEESDDELSATIDDRSEKNYLDDAEALDSRNNNDESEEDVESDREEEEMGRLQDNSVFGKIDLFLDNVNLNKKGSGRSRSEGWTFSDCESESPRHFERILEQGLV